MDMIGWSGKANEFQFPSSGKYHPKYSGDGCVGDGKKRFQFPSSGKYHPKPSTWTNEEEEVTSFNSLQAGNTIQSRCWELGVTHRLKFQFPSSGKYHPKKVVAVVVLIGVLVSIPFKREIPSKEKGGIMTLGKEISFNSLQAGNTIQSFLPKVC